MCVLCLLNNTNTFNILTVAVLFRWNPKIIKYHTSNSLLSLENWRRENMSEVSDVGEAGDCEGSREEMTKLALHYCES